MEQKLRFGLVLGQLAVLKKNWANYEQLLREVYFMFSWAFFFNLPEKYLRFGMVLGWLAILKKKLGQL